MKKSFSALIALFACFTSMLAIPEPVISYSFDKSSDDTGTFPMMMEGTAAIVGMTDGNSVLSTGNSAGYADLGTATGKTVLANLTNNYSIHFDICLGANNSLSRFCWAFAFANGTGQYIGMVNAAGNGNWYYEIKNGTAYQANSRKGLSAGIWHSVSVVQSDNSCSIYVDGSLLGTSNISLRPSSFASSVSQCWLGRSPFGGDAYMTNALIDNFKIFAEALSTEDVGALYSGRPASADINYSDEERAAMVRKELESAFAVRYMHNRINLPSTCSYGVVTWTYDEAVEGYVEFSNNEFRVVKRDSEPVQTGTLQGTFSLNGKSFNVFDSAIPVVVAPDDNAVGYLYCHMPDRVPQTGTVTLVSQTITYALGKMKDNGLVYNELNGGDGIIRGIGTTLPWCRDAFFAKDEKRGCYYIVTTDLYGSLNNGTSMLGNYSIGMFRSYDLINWTYRRCDVKQYLRNNPPTDIYDNSGTRLLNADKVSRVWAPQIIFIGGDPYIYYAVGNIDNGDCDHFYISKANGAFSNITSFQMLYGANTVNNILDADIVYLPTDQLYHMSYRDYAAGDIRDITCADLLNPVWSTDPVSSFTDGSGFEASSVFRRINDDVWNVGNVNYSSNRGFHFHTADAMLRNLQPAAGLSGNLSPQHGSFVMINQTEWDVLQAWSDIKGLIKRGNALLQKKSVATVRALISKCEKDITTNKGNATNLEELAATLKADVEELGKALDEAYPQLSAEDINALVNDATKIEITNGTFGSNANGWTCSPNPAVNNGVGEFFAAYYVDYSASMSQTLSGLDEGDYLVTCQAFERSGHNGGEPHAWDVGSENLHFRLFANTDDTEVCSMYSLTYSGSDALNGYVNGMAGANRKFSENPDNYLCGVKTHVVSDGTLTFGIKSDVHTIHTSNWCCFDNFRVYRLDDATAISSPIQDEETAKQIYSIDGRRMDSLRRGINIIVSADGKVKKIMY